MVCGGGLLVGFWLVCGVVGPSPLLAEVPVCYSPPLLARFRCRWWWAVLASPGGGSRARFPATPRWGPLAAVVCGGVVADVWCGWSLATPGGGSCVLLPATPGWVSLPVVVCGSPPLLAGVSLSAVVCGVWCVVCGVWCAVVVCWWGCGWCVVWLVPRHSWRRFLCATPRHSWLGFAAGRGARSSPLLAEGPGRVSLPLLARVRLRRWCVVGLWLVRDVVGPSPLLAEVPVCYSPATPGWVSLPVVVRGSPPLLAGVCWRRLCVVCGVWCVVCGVQR